MSRLHLPPSEIIHLVLRVVNDVGILCLFVVLLPFSLIRSLCFTPPCKQFSCVFISACLVSLLRACARARRNG